VTEYAKAYGLSEAFVRKKLKNGELEPVELRRNGRKIIGIKVPINGEQEVSANAKSHSEPKLTQIKNLQITNYEELIKEKEAEIFDAKNQLKLLLDELIGKDVEIKNLHEAIQERTNQVQELQEKLKELENKQQSSLSILPALAPKKEKRFGFLAWLFGR